MLSLFALVSTANAEWNYVTSFPTSTGRQHAVVSDGEFIYTAAWGKSSTVLSMFYKYDMEGNFIEEFDVPGVTNSDNYVRDLTYDGQYFYGCDAHSGTIWCYDLHNKTLHDANKIVTNFNELGTCTYDPNYDAFWVGERATGSSPSLQLNLKLIGRDGTVIKTATPYNLGGHTVHGTGHFTDAEGVTHLYLFAVEGFTAHVFDYSIEADDINPNYIFDFSLCPGWGYACSAGGAYIGQVNGVTYFFGDVDKSPNLIGIYALSEYVPPVPVAPEGDIYLDFNDGIIHWNLIDADGDGYNWEIRPNWGNSENPCSLTSASFDDLTQTPLFPENYLVTPWKLDCEQIVFNASVQDITHPDEHLAVAVSTTVGDDPDAFEIVWESAVNAKEAGNWHNFNIDLRAYQGQDIYVAIVHNNSNSQFMVNIDDIILFREFNAAYGISENTVNLSTVYPNPANETLNVASDVTVNHYEIYNMAGAMIMSKPVDEKMFQVNVSELPAGAYLIKMTSEGMVQTKRFVRQ